MKILHQRSLDFLEIVLHFLILPFFRTSGDFSDINGREAPSETTLPIGNFSSLRISLFVTSRPGFADMPRDFAK